MLWSCSLFDTERSKSAGFPFQCSLVADLAGQTGLEFWKTWGTGHLWCIPSTWYRTTISARGAWHWRGSEAPRRHRASKIQYLPRPGRQETAGVALKKLWCKWLGAKNIPFPWSTQSLQYHWSECTHQHLFPEAYTLWTQRGSECPLGSWSLPQSLAEFASARAATVRGTTRSVRCLIGWQRSEDDATNLYSPSALCRQGFSHCFSLGSQELHL